MDENASQLIDTYVNNNLTPWAYDTNNRPDFDMLLGIITSIAA